MKYTESIEESRQYLRLALELIGKHDLPTDPVTYSIWYEYISGKNKALKIAVDNLLKTKGAFTDEWRQRLYNEFIAGGKEAVNELVNEGLQKVISEVFISIKDTNREYSKSEDQIAALNQSFASDFSEAELDIIVGRIKQELQGLESVNLIFQQQLNEASHEIDRLKKKLLQYQDEALTDPLTHIYNRRGFDKHLDDAIKQANDGASSLCLIMADIDHFKHINDTYGHLVGDNVIRLVAETLRLSVKGQDSVARIGGEEFAVILPETPLDGAMQLAGKLRASFETFDFKKKGGKERIGKVTLSFGVTRYQDGEAAEKLVNRADQALYESKNSGRNRVTAG